MHLTIKKNTSEGYAQSEKPNRRSKQNVRAPALSTSTDSQRPLGSNIAQLIHTLCCITSKCSLEHIFHGYRNPSPYWKRKTPRRLSNTITYEHELRQICIPDWGFIHVTAAIAVFIRHYQNPLLVLSLNTHTHARLHLIVPEQTDRVEPGGKLLMLLKTEQLQIRQKKQQRQSSSRLYLMYTSINNTQGRLSPRPCNKEKLIPLHGARPTSLRRDSAASVPPGSWPGSNHSCPPVCPH